MNKKVLKISEEFPNLNPNFMDDRYHLKKKKKKEISKESFTACNRFTRLNFQLPRH